MGYFLLYESMFDTVLYARDKWLSEGGMVKFKKNLILNTKSLILRLALKFFEINKKIYFFF